MTEPTVKNVRDWLERQEVSANVIGSFERTFAPKSPAPRLRVVDLGEPGYLRTWRTEDLEAQPDVLPTIQRVFGEWYDDRAASDPVADFMARITTALTEGGTQ